MSSLKAKGVLMKAAIWFTSFLILVLGACSETKKETIIEKPAEPAVVPMVQGASNCTYAGTSYSHGTLSCQGGYQFQCNNGTWKGLNTTCY
jgi:hypothetical protein